MQISKRALSWSVVAVSAVLLALTVAVVVLTATLNRQADDASYRACMERLDPGTSGVGVEEYSQRMADAAEACSR